MIGARAYGREAAPFVTSSPALEAAVLAVLGRETADVEESRLAVAMGARCALEVERRFGLLERLLVGVLEGRKTEDDGR